MTDNLSSKEKLKLQKEISQKEDDLVKAIQEALQDPNSYKDLEESQFRNLVSVAANTESIEVIKNFLLYQQGREKKWGRGKDSLGQKIINYIDKDIKNFADQINNKIGSEVKNLAWLDLTRRYLGYGYRYLVYQKKGKS